MRPPTRGRPARSNVHVQSNVDPAAWRSEVERVAGKLKVRVGAPRTRVPLRAITSRVLWLRVQAPTLSSAAGAKEWRSHLQQTQAAEDVIAKVLPTTKVSLERVAAELAELLEAVSSREKLINTSFKHLSAEYTSVHDKLTEITTAHQTATQRVAKLTNDLGGVSEALDEVRQYTRAGLRAYLRLGPPPACPRRACRSRRPWRRRAAA